MFPPEQPDNCLILYTSVLKRQESEQRACWAVFWKENRLLIDTLNHWTGKISVIITMKDWLTVVLSFICFFFFIWLHLRRQRDGLNMHQFSCTLNLVQAAIPSLFSPVWINHRLIFSCFLLNKTWISSHNYLKSTLMQLKAVYFIQQTVYIYNSKGKYYARVWILLVFWFVLAWLCQV